MFASLDKSAVSAPPACRQDPLFPPLWGPPEPFFLSWLLQGLSSLPGQPNKLPFQSRPHVIFRTILLFFFLRMNWNHCELLSPDRRLPHWEIRIQILTFIYSRFDSLQEELTGNIKPQLVNWRTLPVWVTPAVFRLNLREIGLTLSSMKNKNHGQTLYKRMVR